MSDDIQINIHTTSVEVDEKNNTSEKPEIYQELDIFSPNFPSFGSYSDLLTQGIRRRDTHL